MTEVRTGVLSPEFDRHDCLYYCGYHNGDGDVPMKKGLSVMEKNTIEEKTTELLKNFGYRDGVDTYVDVVQLARHNGFRVGETSKLPFVEDGFMSVFPSERILLIGVNDNRSFEEKRFIVAHEMAHYFLHYISRNLENAIMHREHIKGKDDDENDADYFAACILMPRNSFRMYYQILKSKDFSDSDIINALQETFLTPIDSIKRRIEEVCI